MATKTKSTGKIKTKSLTTIKKKKNTQNGVSKNIKKAKKIQIATAASKAKNENTKKQPKLLNGEANKLKKKKTKNLPKTDKAEKKIVQIKGDATKKPKISKKENQVNNKKATTNEKKKKKKSSKEQFECLKDIDPEFYDFLKKNDQKLLDFNVFDSDLSDAESLDEEKTTSKQKNNISNDLSDEGSDDDDDDKFHKPNADLKVASDESDFEDEDDDTAGAEGTQKVTLNLLRDWQTQLTASNVSIDVIRKVIQAFNSALASIAADFDNNTIMPYKVVGSTAFNGVIQLCVLHLQPAILRFLGITLKSKIQIHKTKKWNKVRSCLRYYLTDLIRIIEQVSSTNILSVLLKHLHQMSSMVASFSAVGKTILKHLIVLWSTSDETVRVLSFLCILKITRNQQDSMLHHVLKAMYLSYVRNSKFVSPNSLPSINFMRRSLVEMFALDLNVTYQHAFLYIRQLAIHLRNAVILKKKDSFQSVYNWQFINSIRLWTELLGSTANKPQLEPLVYPLVTITLGVIRLIPTAQYFPLRFHCLQSLITLSKETNTFIPVLPLILEVLRSNSFNKKHTNVSMRPLQFACILRLNKTQLSENGFRDEVIEQVHSQTLEFLAHMSSSVAFSDLIVPSVLTLKSYLKECRNSNYSRKLKQLLDKIQENARFIEQERQKITFALQDAERIVAWETQIATKGTPLSIYYNSWVKTQETKKRRQAAQADSINTDYNLPTIKRTSKESTKKRNNDGEVELFPSDTEDEEEGLQLPVDDDEEEKVPTKVKKQKTKKTAVKEKMEKLSKRPKIDEDQDEEIDEEIDSKVDIVKDLDINDW